MNTRALTAHVRRSGLWLTTPPPGLAASAAWLATHAHDLGTRPEAKLLPTRARSRASLLTRMLAEVGEQVGLAEAVAQGAAAQDTALVVGSAWGEFRTTEELLAMMYRDDGALSPARFQASVHNHGAGQLSIACEHRGFTTSLASGLHTVAACLEEAFTLLAHDSARVVVLVGDEPLPDFVSGTDASSPARSALAFGLLLAREPSAGDLAQLTLLDPASAAQEPPVSPDPRWLELNPCSAGLPLLRLLQARQSGEVRLSASGAPICSVRVEPA
jgi:hypothetical protein